MSQYIFMMYSLTYLATIIGTFNHRYNATFCQSIGLSLLGLGALWGASLQWGHTLFNYHDAVISTGLAVFSFGTFVKTYLYSRR